MSVSNNPYRSPEYFGEIYQAESVGDHLMWRKGKLLVIDKKATLPDRCIKSNVPTKRRLKRSFYWHHPAVYLSIFAGLLIYVLLALILRKTAKVHVGLSDEWFSRRRRAIALSWLTMLGSAAMFIAGLMLLERNDAFGWLVLSGIVLFWVGAIYGMVAGRMVTATRVSDTHVWLKGACPEYLAGLPEWPYSP